MAYVSYLFALSGRLSRARYWLFVLPALASLAALFIAFYFYTISFPGAYENGGAPSWPKTPLAIAAATLWGLALLVLFIASFTFAIRRLHDRDKAWWWIVIFFVVPNMLYGLAQYWLQTRANEFPGVPLAAIVLGYGLIAWGLVDLGLLPGTAGPNRFGPDPLAKAN